MGFEEVPSLRREQHPYWEEEGGLALKLPLGYMLHDTCHTSIKSSLLGDQSSRHLRSSQVILILFVSEVTARGKEDPPETRVSAQRPCHWNTGQYTIFAISRGLCPTPT